jgi:hypothetical protein
MKNLIHTWEYKFITSKACQELERIVFHGVAAIYFAGGIKEISQGRYLNGALDFSVGTVWEIFQYMNEKSRYSMQQRKLEAEITHLQNAEAIEAEIRAAKERIAENQRKMAGLEGLMDNAQGKIRTTEEIGSHIRQLSCMYSQHQWYN